MLWFHPILQLVATLLATYAAWLGLQRLRANHFGARVTFRWKGHVNTGRAAMILWLLGLLGGLAMARIQWGVNFVTGAHYQVALIMLPLLIFGLVSGAYMDRVRARRTTLPLAHGVCNLLLLALALFQISTGWQVIQDFIL
ncbi:MAG: DUF4079 family protein [Pseudomonadota bacterium]